VKTRLAYLLATALWALPAYAADLALADLMTLLAGVTSVTDSFVESKQSSLLSTPLVLKGRLVYGRPDRLEKHVLSPYEEHTVIAGDAVSIENRTLKQRKSFNLSASPSAAALIAGMRATLAGDVPALERHYGIRLEGSRDAWLLTLTPRDEKLAGLVTRIRIAGARDRLKRIELDERSGDQSVMLIGPATP
jgi:outer membrane lipoprotein-sorting protein